MTVPANWPAILEDHLSESGVPRNGVLDGTVPEQLIEPATIRYYWRWYDTPDMEPQFLAFGSPGVETAVPFDLQNRAIIIYMIGHSDTGEPSARDFAEAEKQVFGVPTQPTLVDAAFSAPDVTLTIQSNGGLGTIHIFRKFGSGDYGEIGTADFDDTSYVDTPAVNGTYTYKLIQDELPGESNEKSATVTGAGSTAGTVITGLGGTWDAVDTVALGWTNHGGTGAITIERKTGPLGTYAVIATLSSSATSYNDATAFPTLHSKTFYYRAANASVVGYSNEISVFIDADPGGAP